MKTFVVSISSVYLLSACAMHHDLLANNKEAKPISVSKQTIWQTRR